jgi:membrane protein YdbS with pleckstrin-like domain
MSYVDEHLSDGEQVVFRTRLHPLVFALPTLVVLLALDLLLQRRQAAAVFWLEVATVLFAWAAIRYATHEFAVTNRRVIVKVGWLARRTLEIQLSKIESVAASHGPVDRLLGRGSVVIGGTGGTKERFRGILAPGPFHRHVEQAMEWDGAPSREERECPHCAERILVRATRCRYCGQDPRVNPPPA